MRLATLLFVFACTGTDKDDSGEPSDTDTDTDTDADTDTDTDTDTDPRDASVAGMVVLEDGSPAVDLEVQVCSSVCRYLTTDSSGGFSQGSLESARFKIDAMGELSGRSLGNSLFGVDLAVSQVYSVPAALVLPDMSAPVSVSETAGSATYDLGEVQMTFAASDLDLPFGATDDAGDFELSAGVLEGTQVPLLWDVVPQVAVTFFPWLAEPAGTMSLTVTGLSTADGTYQVYALQEYGELEGPIGTATVAKGTATIEDIQPTVWTWIFLVP